MKHYLPVILLVSILWGRVPAWSQTSRDTTLIVYFREDAYQPEVPELNKIDSFLSFNKDARILRAVAAPVGNDTVPDTLVTFTKKLSSGSMVRSLLTVTSKVKVELPVAIVCEVKLRAT